MFDTEILPVELAELAPGPELAHVLAGVDREGMSGYDRVVLLQARARQIAHDQAQFYADIVSVWDAEHELLASEDLWTWDIDELAAAEIRAALTLTRRSADFEVDVALGLRNHPRVWEELVEGRIDLARARLICDQISHLDLVAARDVADQVLGDAGSLTTGQLRARIQRLCISVDPESAKNRYEQGVEERRVTAQSNPDGTANIYGLDLPADRANAVMRRINRLARNAKSAEEERTMDQIRADVFLDLLNGTAVGHGGDRGTVDLHVDLTTLAGLSENPGELNGFGPVIADIARRVVDEQPGSEWRWTVTGDDGTILDHGITGRRPSTSQKRLVQTLNPNCVFPGCRMPAVDCDLDHNQAWQHNGKTTVSNLAPLCRHDHVIKHHGWRIEQLRPGTYQLTSPLGHTYITPARSP